MSEVGSPGLAGAKRYKPYPAYKDSGVEWLGEIPEHWEMKRLKTRIVQSGRCTASKEKLTH